MGIGKQNCFPGQIDHLQYQNTTAGNYAQLLLFLFILPLGLLAGISFLCYSIYRIFTQKEIEPKGEPVMSKKTLSPEQKRLDTDIWIIALVTLAVFCLYAAMGNQLTQFVLDSGRPIFPRLLVNAGIQYGVAGLGITIVCILRREAFSSFGLRKEQAGKAVLGTILVFLPLLCCRYLSGQIEGWQPFSILITEDVLNSGFPLSVLGMAVIILVWRFFEGFNYAVISEKINRRYPPAGLWLDMGAVICAAACLLLHPFNTSFWGIVELITTFTAIYGMLIVKRQTGNAWGCVFAFCFIWNAF